VHTTDGERACNSCETRRARNGIMSTNFYEGLVTGSRSSPPARKCAVVSYGTTLRWRGI
jgi:hypothetical protein